MVRMTEINEMAGRIAREFRPERIILFGSYAGGRPRRDSDVDLMVILHFHGSELRKAAEILDRIGPRVALDLLVSTPRQFRKRLAWNDFFIREIAEKGKVLYEARRSRVG
jgi:predicted nucleotidyltransferase